MSEDWYRESTHPVTRPINQLGCCKRINIMADLNKGVAANLWDALTITVRRFVPKIKLHPQSTFLGYADVVIDATKVLPGLVIQLRGVIVKELKGNPFLDMPSEKGADDKFYPIYFPQTAELRQVLTTAIFQHDGVRSALDSARAMTQPVAAPAEGATRNPFRAGA